MSGTVRGGLATAKKNKSLYGEDFYKRIGKIGGSKPHTRPKGFAYAKAHGLDWAVTAGRKGGSTGKRGKAK